MQFPCESLASPWHFYLYWDHSIITVHLLACNYCVPCSIILLDITAKLLTEQAAKQSALERCEEAEHQSSMLQLDVKNAHDEITTLKADMKIAMAKVKEVCCCCCCHLGVQSFLFIIGESEI